MRICDFPFIPATPNHMGGHDAYIGPTAAPDSTDPNAPDVATLLADLADLVDAAHAGSIAAMPDVINALESAVAALQTATLGTIHG